MDDTKQSGGQTFEDVLRGMVGHVVTIVNPHSYEHAPVGHQLKAGFYRAKVTGLEGDYLTVITEDVKPGKRGEEPVKEPVKQFIPVREVKRVSLRKGERLLHL